MAFWDDILATVEQAPERLLHPLYNNLGRRVGWFTTDQALASGQVQLDPGQVMPQGAPVTLSVMHPGLPSDNQVPVSSLTSVEFYLVSKGIQPRWLGPPGSGGEVDLLTGAAASDRNTVLGVQLPGALPGLQLPQITLPAFLTDPATGQPDVGKLALIGAFGLLALVVILRRE